MHQNKLGANQLGTSLAEKDLGGPTDKKLNMNQHCMLPAKKAKSRLGYMRKTITNRLRDVILRLYSALVRHTWETGSSSGFPTIRKTQSYWTMPSKQPRRRPTVESLSSEIFNTQLEIALSNLT